MKTETKILFGVLFLTVIIIIIGLVVLAKSSTKTNSTNSTNTVYQIDYSKGHKIGSDSAKIKLVEFSDFQCPACRAAEPIVEEIISNSKNKDLEFIYRNYPLSQHLNAKAAVNAAEAASDQNKFWEMHNKLFATQDKWESLQDPADYFANLAKDLSLDSDKIKEAVQKNTYNSKIQDNINNVITYDLNALPTFYLNVKKLELSSFNDLKDQVNQALTQK